MLCAEVGGSGRNRRGVVGEWQPLRGNVARENGPKKPEPDAEALSDGVQIASYHAKVHGYNPRLASCFLLSSSFVRRCAITVNPASHFACGLILKIV